MFPKCIMQGINEGLKWNTMFSCFRKYLAIHEDTVRTKLAVYRRIDLATVGVVAALAMR